MVNRVQNASYIKNLSFQKARKQNSAANFQKSFDNSSSSNVSFNGSGAASNNKIWLYLKRLSMKMTNVSEITNAVIAAIGTGIIAFGVILVSPGKGDKEDKDKKFFQAIRQPLSAGLALGFQVPATLYVNKTINKMAYEKKLKFFNDDLLGSLIPDKKYLAKNLTQSEIDAKLKEFETNPKLKENLEKIINKEYEDANVKLPDSKELANRVQKEKVGYVKQLIVEDKYNQLLDEKVKELSGKDIKIDENKLITKDTKQLAEQLNKDKFVALEKNANLNGFDKFIDLMGFSNKKLSKLEAEKNKLKQKLGLELLKEDNPEWFDNSAKGKESKLKEYIKVMDEKAHKDFSSKKFWISLLVNLFMVTASCYALNWSHPRFKEMIDKFKANKEDKNNMEVNK